MTSLLHSLALVVIDPKTLNVPMPTNTNPLPTLLNIFFSITGGVAVLVITIAGLTYTTSQGDPNRIAKARNTIVYAAVGLGVSASALIIVNFVLGQTK